MITHNIAFNKTLLLIKKYLRVERALIVKVMLFVGLKNIFLIPIPYLIQILVNDYFNLNLETPVILISFLIFFLITLYYLSDYIIFYLSELLKRNLFLRSFFKVSDSLQNDQNHIINSYHVPRFLEVSFAKEELVKVIQNLSQVLIVLVISTALIISYHPYFLIYSFVLIISLIISVVFLYPKALLYSSAVSDVKYKMNEYLMRIAEKNKENSYDYSSSISFKFLKSSSQVFKILLLKTIAIGSIVALSQGFFIYISGLLIIAGSFSIGQFVAAEIVNTYLLGSIYTFTKNLEQMINIIVSLDKLNSVAEKDL